jgi:DNA polymerase III delta subunit
MARTSRPAAARAADSRRGIDASMRVVVLHGPERFFILEHTRRLIEALRAEHGDIDTFTLDGERASVADVLDELRSYALIQRHKLVIVEDADLFLSPGGRRAARGEADADGEMDAKEKERDNPKRRALEKYAEAPVPDATLLLRAPTWRPGTLDKLVANVGAVIKCESPGAAEAERWCASRASEVHDARLDAEAAAMLVDRIGCELTRLDTELEKLATLAGRGGRILTSTVDAMVPASRQEKFWQLKGAVLTGEPSAALAKVRELMDISRQEAVPLTWSVVDLTRVLHAAARMLEQGVSSGHINSRLKLFGADSAAVLEVARRTPPTALAQLLRRAMEYETAGKSGRGDPVLNLEALTVFVADRIKSSRR